VKTLSEPFDGAQGERLSAPISDEAIPFMVSPVEP
jgi:hypothetical protein